MFSATFRRATPRPRQFSRLFSTSRAARNTASQLSHSVEIGAAVETQDVATVDALLRVLRGRTNPENQTMLPIRTRVKWHDTLRASLSRPLTNETENHAHYQLKPRTMSDSYCEHVLPFASSSELLEAYTNTSGGIRTGKLMEHLDSLAGSIAYRHMLGPVDTIGNFADLGFYIVTASVDRLDMLASMYPVRDLRLSGQVIYVGKSSMEIAVRMEAVNSDGTEDTIMLGRFCMVCRDSKTQQARPVNPLVRATPEDEKLYQIGEAYKKRRTQSAGHSLSRVPPSSEESAALHSLYLESSTGYPSDGERVPMGDTRLEKTLTMYPQERNVHSKIFGGYLMRLAYELGYSNSMIFTRGPVRFLSLDSISFAKPVPIGSVLHLTSHILHTASSSQYPALIHVGVKATVIGIKTGEEQLTNDFRFTWCREREGPSRIVVPMTYQEAMWWVEGKRALELGAEIRGIRKTHSL